MGAGMDSDPYDRFAVRVHARLFAVDLPGPIDCVICNQSENGAQLTVEQPVKLPTRLPCGRERWARA